MQPGVGWVVLAIGGIAAYVLLGRGGVLVWLVGAVVGLISRHYWDEQ